MRLLLLQNGQDIHATQKDKYEFVVTIACGKMRFEQIAS